ncbi:MAG: low temperature requirement protein A [Acidimicrobiia bacterium]|nr:low temperature requirement protein A [Acidimicrobiia bacterium]MDH5504029.1 low temperature requirement protein A [Acidimicrobiia bacterium]
MKRQSSLSMVTYDRTIRRRRRSIGVGDLEEQLLEDKAVLPLELFFDLVFVLGITQTVALVVAGHDGQALGRAFLVLAMLWWAWTQFSWTANAIDLHAPRVRFSFFAAMGAALIMAVSVPTAFEDGGLWLALGYVGVRGIGVWLHISGTTDQVMLASVKFFALVSWPGPLAIVVGAFLEPPARSWIWLLGFVLEFAAAGLAGGAEWNIRAGHFAERHGLIYIIAIGESIVAIGIVASGKPLNGVLAATMVLAIAGACLLWWSYFDRLGETIEDALREAGNDQGIVARDAFSLGHFPMIAGIVLFATAAEEIVGHADDPLGEFTRLLLALSIGLVMLAQVGTVKRVGGPLLVERIGAAAAVALLMLPAIEVRANLMFLAVVLVLAAALVLERRRDPLLPQG